MKKRPRVSVIILSEDRKKILLIYRYNPEIVNIFPNAQPEYYVVPGGGNEEGETFEQTALREIKEELNVDVELDRQVFDFEGEDKHEYVYLAKNYSGNPEFGNNAPEMKYASEQNIYRLEWIDMNELEKINLKPEIYKNLILENLKNGNIR